MEKRQTELLAQFKNQRTRFSEEELEQLLQRLPPEYYRLTDPDDLAQNLKYLDPILHNEKHKLVYESDIETFALLHYDYLLLKTTMKEFYQTNPNPSKLFRLYKDKDKAFFILGSYHIPEGSPRAQEPNLQMPSWAETEIMKNNPGLKKRIHITAHSTKNHTSLEIQILNSSTLTLFKNLWEILEAYNYSFIETWLQEKLTRKVKNIFKITIHFFNRLEAAALQSVKKDLERYLQSFISYRSVFDIVGPAMVGPSSSHTAGANRIGQIARKILEALLLHKKISVPIEIKIKLLGSFRDTGIGHHTPEAIIGGLCGLPTHDDTMIKTGLEAIKHKDTFRFFLNGIENTPVLFGGFIKGNPDEDAFYKSEQNNNIAEIIAVTDSNEISITGFSIGGGNVEIRYINRKKLDEIIDGKKAANINYNSLATGSGHEVEQDSPEVSIAPIDKIDKEVIALKEEYIPLFNTFEEMLEVFGENTQGAELIQQMVKVEEQISGKNTQEIYDSLLLYWQIMKRAVNKGLRDKELSTFRLTGGDSARILSAVEGDVLGLKDSIYGKAVAYSVSVNEVNARSGLIVACPTGGSCGILPGVLCAWEESTSKYSPEEKEKRILEAMMVAGFFGMVLFDDVPTAGADLGCQAEIGGGAAMTAAALVYLENGSLNRMVEAFTLALKNSMGLVCDPVAGLVEVPCVKRNGIYATAAISAALYALAGVKSMISPDEVVLAVKEVGERMNDDYKETAKGGLAQTRDGKKINRLFEQTTAQFFH